MVETCPQAELACSQEKATCTHIPTVSNESVEEITEELSKLKERKCMMTTKIRVQFLFAIRNVSMDIAQIQTFVHVMLDGKDINATNASN